MQKMPGSCDSEENSSPSLISKLRQFRFQKKSKHIRFSPTAKLGESCDSSLNSEEEKVKIGKKSSPLNSQSTVIPETPESQRPSSSSSSTKNSENGHELDKSKFHQSPLNRASQSTVSDLESPLQTQTKLKGSSFEDQNSESESPLLARQITKRIRQAILSDSEEESKTPKVLKLNSVEIAKLLKELSASSSQSSPKQVVLNQPLKVTNSGDSSSSGNKVFKINSAYLTQLLKSITSPSNNKLSPNKIVGTQSSEAISVHTSEQSEDLASKKSAEYSSDIVKSEATVQDIKFPQSKIADKQHSEIISTETSKVVEDNCSTSQEVSDTKNQKLLKSEAKRQAAMDEYDVFCEKEKNLRKLLKIFPGADIMEAQDILVACQWNLEKALEVVKSKPLRQTRRKIVIPEPLGNTSGFGKGVVYDSEMTNSEWMQLENLDVNEETKTSVVTEEIVLDSSDESIEDIVEVPNCNVPSSVSNCNVPPSVSNSNVPPSVSNSNVPPSVSDSNVPPSVSKSNVPPSVSKSNVPPSVSKSNVPPSVSKSNVSPSVSKSNVPPSVSKSNVPPSVSKSNVPPSVSKSNVPPSVSKSNVPPSVSKSNVSSSVSKSNVPSSVSNSNIPPSLGSNLQTKAQVGAVIHYPSSSEPPVKKMKRIIPVNDDSDEEMLPHKVNDNQHLHANKSHQSANNLSHFAELNKLPLTITEIHTPKVTSEHKNRDDQGNSNTKTPNMTITCSKISSSSSVPTNVLSESVSIDNSSTSSSFCIDEQGNIKKTKESKENSARIKHTKKRKKKDFGSDDDDGEEYGNQDVYDSEESDVEDTLTPARGAVFTFFQSATNEEFATVPGCSKKKAEVIQKYRPFKGWADLVQKLGNDKHLSTDLLNGAKKVLDMRTAVNRLMAKCEQIAYEMEDLVENLKEEKDEYKDYITHQPNILNNRMHLAQYQMLGLNWLLLMHNQEVNGILADEMGLGKTVQAIAFLAYLKEQEIDGPHLIVVPSSTLDNWQKELQTWWPSSSVLCYHGAQDNRKEMRLKIINDEVEDFDIMITTYNMVTSSAEDRSFFKRLDFHYVIFDEAHMLKNMSSQRYQNLMRIRASRRLLLTGTPLQNNLVELMSLLIFVMPHMFSGKIEHIKQMFSSVCKSDDGRSKFEQERIEHAKRIMKPFVLRRLKSEVLQDLPAKQEETRFCPMTEFQRKQYFDLVTTLSEEVKKNKEKDIQSSGTGMMMQLRKAANHPLLLRNQYDDAKLLEMAKLMLDEPTHKEANPDLIFEDMQVMSDFELHQLCKMYKKLMPHKLCDSVILESGKFRLLDSLLPDMIKQDHRVLLFSQFTMMLDVVEEYMKIKNYKYLRLDGSVPVSERQQLIDKFNEDPEIFIFLLSTRAGGLGINLTAADVVLLHDIDFNPYNDKQAEDRCHRVGQTRDVTVMRFISKETIEEGILQRAKDKLKLEKDITSVDETTEENDSGGVAMLLKNALGLTTEKS